MKFCRDCSKKATTENKTRCHDCTIKHNSRNKAWRLKKKDKNKNCIIGEQIINVVNITNNFNVENKKINDDDEKIVLAKISKNVGNRLYHGIKNQIRWFESSEQLLGCTLNEYKAFIEKQFEQGMKWENWGQWSIDHIKPISSFDLCDPLQRLKAFHHSNTRPVWSNVNLKKSAT